MKYKLFSKATKLSLKHRNKFIGPLIAGSLIFALITLRKEETSMGQEKIPKERPAPQRAPDDLTDNFVLPFLVNDCFDKNKWLDKEIEVPNVLLHNPYFVRGDLDGDRSIDYAVIVESRKNGREGLLICFRNKEAKAVLLGLDPNNPPPFWLLMNWDIETPAEVRQALDSDGKPIGIKPTGESIVMKGEGWEGIIYWDGQTFRWKKVILNDGN